MKRLAAALLLVPPLTACGGADQDCELVTMIPVKTGDVTTMIPIYDCHPIPKGTDAAP